MYRRIIAVGKSNGIRAKHMKLSTRNMVLGFLRALPHIIFACSLIAICIYQALHYPHMFLFYTKEDAGIETGQFIFYLLSCTICFRITDIIWKQNDKLLSAAFFIGGLAFGFIAMEEISWGQRIFMFVTPETFRSRNYQEEFNLHNTSVSLNNMLFIIIGLYGTISGVCYQLIRSTRFGTRHQQRLTLIIVPIRYAVYFLPVLLYYASLHLLKDDPFAFIGNDSWRMQEPFELLLSLGCYLGIFQHYHTVQLSQKL